MKKIMRTHSKKNRGNRRVYREVCRAKNVIYQGMDFIDVLRMATKLPRWKKRIWNIVFRMHAIEVELSPYMMYIDRIITPSTRDCLHEVRTSKDNYPKDNVEIYAILRIDGESDFVSFITPKKYMGIVAAIHLHESNLCFEDWINY